jgi:hypothetical protein
MPSLVVIGFILILLAKALFGRSSGKRAGDYCAVQGHTRTTRQPIRLARHVIAATISSVVTTPCARNA